MIPAAQMRAMTKEAGELLKMGGGGIGKAIQYFMESGLPIRKRFKPALGEIKRQWFKKKRP